MAKQPNENDLQNFVLNFNEKVVAPLTQAGFVRNKFNVFDILGIERQELRHSDFLAFLLNPNRSGEVGRQFLPAFLSLVAKEHPDLGLDFFQVFYGNFNEVTVKREYQHIDILLDINLAGDDYVVVIENKVDSDEQIYKNKEFKSQLAVYKNIAAKDYPNHQRILLFLSPDKHKPTETGWHAIDYRLVYTALSMVNLETADNTVKILINDYLKLLKGKFNMEIDEKLKAAALRIYEKDKDIFDFIFACKPNLKVNTGEIIRAYIRQLDWVELETKQANTVIVFTVNAFKTIRPDLKIYFQISTNEFSIMVYLESDQETEQDRKILGLKRKSKISYLWNSEYLKENNRDKTQKVMKEIDANLLKNQLDLVETTITELLDNAFAENGYVQTHTRRIIALLSANQNEATKSS